MRIAFIIIGIILVFLGLFQAGKYIKDYEVLTEYGKGYVWGSVILLVLGVALIVLGKRKANN